MCQEKSFKMNKSSQQIKNIYTKQIDMCVNDSVASHKKLNKSSVRLSLLNNMNPLTFAILMKRTTFTVVLILLSISNVSCESTIQYVTPSNSNSTLLSFTTLTKGFDVTTEASKIISRKYSNKTYFDTGNKLWDGLLNECMTKPSISCVQKNVFSFLDEGFGISGDVNVTNSIVFKRNELAHWKYSEHANTKSESNSVEEEDMQENEIETDEPRYMESPIEEISNALYEKSITFLMRHDLELKLPEIMFNGATLKVSPRAIDGDGALVKLDLIPREQSEGRILFKKIKKFIKNKILLAVLVIIVIIKIIKLKLFVFLPLIMGIHNAKKLFLKLVLFVFPALGQIFKLCSWYHNEYHQTKYHHHHHKITHVHHGVPHIGHSPHSPAPSYGVPHAPIISSPEKPYSSYDLPVYSHEEDWASTGNVPDYIAPGFNINRNSVSENFSPRPEDANIIKAWGLDNFGGSPATSASQPAAIYAKPSPYFEQQKIIMQQQQAELNKKRPATSPTSQEKEALIKAAHKQAEKLAQAQVQAQLQQKLQQQQQFQQQQQQQQIQQKQQNIQQQVYPQQHIQYKQNAISPEVDGFKASPVYDPFYGAILQKVDQVFVGLSFYNEPCRERLVCSMYKNPQRFSPHSNLISNELSRDPTELPKPTANSGDATRYYKYVQAARDGQENKDCLALYPHCSVDTERKKKKK